MGSQHLPARELKSSKPIILHLGDPIHYEHALHDSLQSQFTIIRPPLSDLHRPTFIQHLKEKDWGDFSATIRPHWITGGEMLRWDKELIELLPTSMKVMTSAGAGYDWVDTDCLAEHGILYCNGAGASNESVADMALWLIISVFRQMTWSSLAARSNQSTQWQDAHRHVPSASHNPRGHTLGIIGLGNIGLATARKVQAALGMRIIYHDVSQKPQSQEDEVQATFYKALDDMLCLSDCVLVAMPPTGDPILNSRTLAILPRGARVVNVARGSLIDEEALADALDSEHISAAGLDVQAREPYVNERLSSRQNVTLTCHTGGGSVETHQAFEELAMENVKLVLNGKDPKTGVNTDLMKKAKAKANGIHENGAEGNVTEGAKVSGEKATMEVMDEGTMNGNHQSGPRAASAERSDQDSRRSPCGNANTVI